ncbi:MAG: hypothetical protein U5R31_15885 [Acidimicrobiia bacterium]|nr:hypothetical protein [Acidimicrobiia bacterium]
MALLPYTNRVTQSRSGGGRGRDRDREREAAEAPPPVPSAPPPTPRVGEDGEESVPPDPPADDGSGPDTTGSDGS